MPLLDTDSAKYFKLKTIPKSYLAELCDENGLEKTGNVEGIIERLSVKPVPGSVIDEFIRRKYNERLNDRAEVITKKELKTELNKVEHFRWRVVQGELDRMIRRDYAWKFPKYADLISAVEGGLYEGVKDYATCLWYNYWTNEIIEEIIFTHDDIVPALKRVKGIDFFFKNQPFDLKVTNLPRSYDIFEAVAKPLELAAYLYENQGRERFGDDNRMFLILYDIDTPQDSWKLKREFRLIEKNVNSFFTNEGVTRKDTVVFNYDGENYSALAKILIISR